MTGGRARVPAPRTAAPRAVPATVAAAGAALACAVLAAGCGTTPAPGGAATAPAGASAPLTASVTSPGGTSWAVLEMGGSRAANNNFWQLVARPAGGTGWILATPPGVADNGGLVAAPLGGRALLAGFNPSQDLTFSPLATTRDSGGHWAPGLLPTGLAVAPSALAAGPGGRLLALTGRGRVQAAGAAGASWAGLTSLTALARTAAARACGLTALTAVAFSPAGTPVVAGTCARPGAAGVFSFTGGSWHAAGPALPAALAHRRVTVLRLAAAGSRMVALLSAVAAGTGSAGTGSAAAGASVLAAWATAGGPWVLSAPLVLGEAGLRSTAAGPGGAVGVVFGTGLGATVTPPDSASNAAAAAAPWHRLPALPAHTADLVLGPAAQVSALAPDGSVLVSWRLAARGSWVQQQVMKVPVPLGSSG